MHEHFPTISGFSRKSPAACVLTTRFGRHEGLGKYVPAGVMASTGVAYTLVFVSTTNDYMFRKTLTVRLSAEDEKMFARLLQHKASQTAQFGLPPPSQSQLMRALIRKAYLDLTQDGHRQRSLV